jgi:hypothetical protein
MELRPDLSCDISKHPKCTERLYRRLIKEHSSYVQVSISNNPNVSGQILEFLWNYGKECGDVFFIKWGLLENPNTPPHIRQEAMNY